MTDASTEQLPPLLVGVNPQAVWKLFRPFIRSCMVCSLSAGLLAVASAALFTEISGLVAGFVWGTFWILFAIFFSCLALYFMKQAATGAAAGTILTLDATGFAVAIPQGSLVLPWEAVGSIRMKSVLGQRIPTFEISERVTRDSPGVHTSLKPALFRRMCKKGIPFGQTSIDVPVETILDAAAAFTAGRLRVL